MNIIGGSVVLQLDIVLGVSLEDHSSLFEYTLNTNPS